MKYWRGYLVAAVFAALSWGLTEFAKTHADLVDMIYPYATRLIQSALADWSSGVSFCLWQVILLALLVALLTSVVLMIVLRWNPVQWFGWVLAVITLFSLMDTGLYKLNAYAGSVADDIRLSVQVGYTPAELSDAAIYFRDRANHLSGQVDRDSSHQLQTADFDVLALQAADSFKTLTYDKAISIYAGTTVPVKELGWSDRYTKKGTTGITVSITGEAAVNPQVPGVGLPFAMCHEMAHRMCIYNEDDADFSAFLACDVNDEVLFRYAGYALAYRACINTLSASSDSAQRAAATTIASGASSYLSADLAAYDAFMANREEEPAPETQDTEEETQPRPNFTDLLVSWYIQEIVLPQHAEEEVVFDPLDESQVDLSGLVNAG